MTLEITLDETLLQDLFGGTVGDPEKLNRITRMERHVLVWSKELLAIWRKLEESELFRANPILKQQFQYLITQLPQKPSKFRMVHPTLTGVQGDPNDKQRVVLGTAYQSKDKIVVGNYPEPLRLSNVDLIFVSKEAFSKPKSSTITWDQVRIVLSRSSNFIDDLFQVFETPIRLEVPEGSDSDLLACYLANFYDEDHLVIQDAYFVQNDGNEQNFVDYVLPKVHPNCQITLRSQIKRETRVQGLNKQSKYESMSGRKIKVDCLHRHQENLHDGYFETSKYRLTIPYRLGIFGANGKNLQCTIHINAK